MNKAERIYLF